jgi:hypothetical protein
MIKVDQPVLANCQKTKPQVDHAHGVFSIGRAGRVWRRKSFAALGAKRRLGISQLSD